MFFPYQCASTIQFEKEAPTEIEDVYFQKWNSGIKEGSFGINLLIKTNGSSIELDSVYFRYKATKFYVDSRNKNTYIGRFTYSDERTNMFPKLSDNECVLSYKSGDGILYFKILSLREKEPLNYPNLPSSQEKI